MSTFELLFKVDQERREHAEDSRYWWEEVDRDWREGYGDAIACTPPRYSKGFNFAYDAGYSDGCQEICEGFDFDILVEF